jgi:4-amino-4-deoxy-L-arabinose transferase-like glycosyltransferase
MNETRRAVVNDARNEFLSWRTDRVLVALIVAATLLGLIYNGVILLGYGPDEGRHMNYVKLLLNEGSLPYLEPDPAAPGRTREHASAHSLHPPLYYAALLPFYALLRGLPGEGEWHMLRVFSVLLCVAALPLWYAIALQVSRHERWFARLSVAHIALLPVLGMTSGVINNDSATFFAVALSLWLLTVKYPNDVSLRSAFFIGICFGLGGLCKATALLCNGIALLVYWWMQRAVVPLHSAVFWKRAAIIVACVLVLCGPWYGRNLALYGQFAGPIEDGYSLVDIGFLPRGGALVMMLHENFPFVLRSALWSIFYSLWSQKDWIPETIRPAVYIALGVYCLLAVAGLIVAKAHRAKSSSRSSVQPETQGEKQFEATAGAEKRAGSLALWAPLAALGINWLACVTIALFKHWGWHEGGRYLLPSLGALGIVLALGWSGLLGNRRLPYVFGVWCVALLALNAVAIYHLITYLNPKYGPGA